MCLVSNATLYTTCVIFLEKCEYRINCAISEIPNRVFVWLKILLVWSVSRCRTNSVKNSCFLIIELWFPGFPDSAFSIFMTFFKVNILFERLIFWFLRFPVSTLWRSVIIFDMVRLRKLWTQKEPKIGFLESTRCSQYLSEVSTAFERLPLLVFLSFKRGADWDCFLY